MYMFKNKMTIKELVKSLVHFKTNKQIQKYQLLIDFY